MLSANTHVKVYLCTAPMNMCKGFDSLVALVANTLKHDPLSGHWFVFLNCKGGSYQSVVLGWQWIGTLLQTAGRWRVSLATAKRRCVNNHLSRISVIARWYGLAPVTAIVSSQTTIRCLIQQEMLQRICYPLQHEIGCQHASPRHAIILHQLIKGLVNDLHQKQQTIDDQQQQFGTTGVMETCPG